LKKGRVEGRVIVKMRRTVIDRVALILGKCVVLCVWRQFSAVKNRKLLGNVDL
jgi:hypothetical protein